MRDRADRLLASPEEPSRFARGVSAGAFAAMVPVFGLLIALAAAWLARGSRTTAAAACLLIGNPLTHAVTLPIAYELGHWMLPAAVVPGHIPPWLGTLLPIGEEALVGGALLGTVVAGFAYAVARCALRPVHEAAADADRRRLEARMCAAGLVEHLHHCGIRWSRLPPAPPHRTS